MKTTSLTTLALILAGSFPTSLLASLAGLDVPTALDATHTLGVFVTALTLLTISSDYAPRSAAWLTADTRRPAPVTAAVGTEERRLAA
jgi:hypothetical protein